MAKSTAQPGVTLSKEQREQVAHRILFDFSHAAGRSDARVFAKKMNLAPGLEALAAAPAHMAHAGWAVVALNNIDDHQLLRDESTVALQLDHLNSFETHSHAQFAGAADEDQQQSSTYHSVCVMNSGYSSGWLCEALGHSELVAAEVMCRARGEPHTSHAPHDTTTRLTDDCGGQGMMCAA
jgi:hypothetical protein